jgi:hypothetical protein
LRIGSLFHPESIVGLARRTGYGRGLRRQHRHRTFRTPPRFLLAALLSGEINRVCAVPERGLALADAVRTGFSFHPESIVGLARRTGYGRGLRRQHRHRTLRTPPRFLLAALLSGEINRVCAVPERGLALADAVRARPQSGGGLSAGLHLKPQTWNLKLAVE